MPETQPPRTASIETSVLHRPGSQRTVMRHPTFGACFLLEPLPQPVTPIVSEYREPFAPVTLQPAKISMTQAITLVGHSYAKSRDLLLRCRIIKNDGRRPYVWVKDLRRAGITQLPASISDLEDMHKLPEPTGQFLSLTAIRKSLSYVLAQTKEQRKERAPRILVYPNRGITWDTSEEELQARCAFGQHRSVITGVTPHYHVSDFYDNTIFQFMSWASPHESSIELWGRLVNQYYFKKKGRPPADVAAALVVAGKYRLALTEQRMGRARARQYIDPVAFQADFQRDREAFYKLKDVINTEPFLKGCPAGFQVLL